MALPEEAGPPPESFLQGLTRGEELLRILKLRVESPDREVDEEQRLLSEMWRLHGAGEILQELREVVDKVGKTKAALEGRTTLHRLAQFATAPDPQKKWEVIARRVVYLYLNRINKELPSRFMTTHRLGATTEKEAEEGTHPFKPLTTNSSVQKYASEVNAMVLGLIRQHFFWSPQHTSRPPELVQDFSLPQDLIQPVLDFYNALMQKALQDDWDADDESSHIGLMGCLDQVLVVVTFTAYKLGDPIQMTVIFRHYVGR